MEKKKKNKNTKYFSIKNYLWKILIILFIILLIWYIFAWYNVKKEEKLLVSYLISTNTLNYETDDISEINQILKESPNNYFIYISYTKNNKIYNLEKKLKTAIDEYDLKDSFYYVNIDNNLEDKDLTNKLNKMFNTDKIKGFPCILYFNNNELTDIISNKEKIFDYKKFKNLLDKYDYEKNSL